DVDGHIAKLSGALAVQKPIQEQINKDVDATQDANLRARLNRRDYANAAALTTDLPVQKRIQTLINGAKAEGLVGEQAAAVMNGKNYASEALAQTDLVALKQALATTGGRVTPAGPVDRNNHPLDEHGKPKTDLTVLPDGTTLVNAKGEPIDPSTGKPKAGANPGDVTRNQAELAELAKANARLDAALKSEKDADRKNLIEEMRASGRVHTDAEATAWLTGKESDKTSTLASEAATLRDVKQLGAAQGAALDGQLDQVKALDTTVGSVKDLDARVTRGVDRDTASVQSLQASVAAQKPIQEQINKDVDATQDANLRARLNRRDYANAAALTTDLPVQKRIQTLINGAKAEGLVGEQAAAVMNGKNYASEALAQTDLVALKQALATTGGRVTPAGPVDRNNHPLDEHGKPKTDLTVLPDGTTLVNAKGEPIDPSTGKPKAGANPGDVTRNQAELAELAKANARLDAALKSEKDADRKNLIEEMRASGRVHTDAEATAWLTGKESDKTSTLASEAATLRDVKQLGAAQGAALDGQLDQVKALDTTVGSVKDLDARVTRGVDRDTASVQSLQASVAAQKPIQEQINKLPTGTESEKAIVARMNAKDYASLAAAQA
ncbi:hypothetical protein DF039_38000, partial [Burkholderia cenocepacia]